MIWNVDGNFKHKNGQAIEKICTYEHAKDISVFSTMNELIGGGGCWYIKSWVKSIFFILYYFWLIDWQVCLSISFLTDNH